MRPGYRKNTSFIVSNRTDTGFINKNQAKDLIREYTTNEEFYEIEPAEVTRIFLNPDEVGFPVNRETGRKRYELIGCIRVRLIHSQKNRDQVLDEFIKPLSPHIVQYPIVGELVNVADYNGQLYYSNPLNVNGSIYSNKVVNRYYDDVMPSLLKYNRKILAEPGDMVIQGRFGQSIWFNSDVNNVKPSLKISVGQGFNKKLNDLKQVDPSFPHITNINSDEASIWITTAENVPLKTSAKSADKTVLATGSNIENPLSSLITLNADGLIFNSRSKKIQMFSKTNVNISATDEINLETESGVINLLDPNSNNPLVKGKQLNVFLKSMISVFEKHANSIDAFLRSRYSERSQTYKDLTRKNRIFRQEIRELKSELEDSSWHSKRAFIGSDDLDNIWETAEWTSAQNTRDQSYEVEKITDVAGVRG